MSNVCAPSAQSGFASAEESVAARRFTTSTQLRLAGGISSEQRQPDWACISSSLQQFGPPQQLLRPLTSLRDFIGRRQQRQQTFDADQAAFKLIDVRQHQGDAAASIKGPASPLVQPSPSQPGRVRSPFASLSTSIAAQRGQQRLRQTFNEIDAAGKGFVNEADLHAFAKQQGLPAAYVPAFMAAVAGGDAAQAAPSGHSAGQRTSCRQQAHSAAAAANDGSTPGDKSAAALPQQIPFDSFESFVRSREAGLRATFDALDTDGNGSLDASELAAALESVRVECPSTRRVYHCRRKAVEELLSRAEVAGRQAGSSDGGVSFPQFRSFFLLLPASNMMADYWLSVRCAGLCDIGASVALHDVAAKGSPWRHLVAGALAGAASRTATAPLETLRLQAMTGASVGVGTLAAARAVMAKAGWRGLYRGNAMNVLRSAPQKALDFFAFDILKGVLKAGSGGGGRVFAAAGLAGCTSNAILYPLEVVRTRLTADTAGCYTGMRDAFMSVALSEGPAGLYRGLLPSLIGMLPEAAITYGMFDTLKARYRAAHAGSEPGTVQVLAYGVASAFMGQLVAFPLETVSRRLQVDRGASFLALTARLLREEGPLALYRGVGAASLRVVPMACVSFGTYEVARNGLTKWEESGAGLPALLPRRRSCRYRPRIGLPALARSAKVVAPP